MIIRIFIVCMIVFCNSADVFSQKQTKASPAPAEGVLFFSLTAEKNGKTIVIVKDNGKTVDRDSLKMADRITACYKVGQKSINVKGIVYDNYFLSAKNEPTILQDIDKLSFDVSIWTSCIDSLAKKEQIVFQIREITLEDGTKIKNPKLMKDSKAVYRIVSNPNFPEGGWESKAKHWISMWKEWFKLKDDTFYKLDDKSLELYATGIVYTIK